MSEPDAAVVHGEEEQGFKQTAKDLFSGAMGGIAQVLIGEFSCLLGFFFLLVFEF